MKPVKKCAFMHIHGKVQGVFFRATAQAQAEKLELNGYVRNEIDGSISVEVEGSKTGINEFVKWAKSGPKYAEVSQVDVKEVPVQHYTTFSVL